MATVYLRVCITLLLLAIVQGNGSVNSWERNTDSSPCCASHLMDNTGRVILERNTPLLYTGATATFNTIKVKFCLDADVFIQLWKPSTQSAQGNPDLNQVSDSLVTYELAWQMNIQPETTSQLDEWMEIRIPGDPVEMREEYRLGLHVVSDCQISDCRFPISYDFDTTHPPLFRQVWEQGASYTTEEYNVGTALAFDKLPWPRSYYKHIRFCYKDTSGLAIQERCINGDPPNMVVVSGPPGAQGPPGPPGTCECQGCIGGGGGMGGEDTGQPTCAMDAIFSDQINVLNDQINNLLDKLNDPDSASQTNNRLVTGLCPNGFTPGSYGLGHCYLVVDETTQLGATIFKCAENSALPLWIESEVEEGFVTSMILEKLSDLDGNVQFLRYRTGGMYSEDSTINPNRFDRPGMAGDLVPISPHWVWHSEGGPFNTAMDTYGYSNWAEGEPREFNNKQACMDLRVNADRTHNWHAHDCRDKLPFICKVAKRCM